MNVSPAGQLALEPRAAAPAHTPPLILVAGNPNSGKSTLFNALSGAHTKVSNYPGVTVCRLSATISLPVVGEAQLVDLPGTYSLAARSQDEQVAVDAVLGLGTRPPDGVVVVADATALGRGLYLAFEIIETGVPAVVALSMMDEARSQQITIEAARLGDALGVPVVPVVARRGEGLEALRRAIARMVTGGRSTRPVTRPLPIHVESALRELEPALAAHWPELGDVPRRALAIWLLLSVDDDSPHELRDLPAGIVQQVATIRARTSSAGGDLDQDIIAARYSYIDAVVARAVGSRGRPGRRWTERLDAVLTHRVAGLAVFVAVMLALFQALFSWAEPAIALIEGQVVRAQELGVQVLPPGPVRNLIVDGVIAGVGNVIVFVPQIALLFLFIGFMEDVGYLARVAFVIDRVMARVGLHGKSFVPMLSGFSCAIPAVMATRTLENRTDRILTMMVLPFMSCSARLPIYLLVIATVFSGSDRLFGVLSVAAVVLLAMYLLSVAAALAAAAVLRRTVLRGPRPTLMLELPPYRVPVLRVLVGNTWRQVRSFLVGAGTIILALTIVLWAFLSYPRNVESAARHEALRTRAATTLLMHDREAALADIAAKERGEQLRHSIAGRLGHLLEPAIEPLGFDWRIGIGILGAFAAREVFVSTMGIVFDLGDADEANQPLRDALRSARRSDGSPLMTPLTGVSLMVFFVLACQCMSTLAIVRRESGSWKWPLFLFVYQTAVAYTAAFIAYQGGRLLGFA